MTFRRWTADELDALRTCYATPTTTRMGHLPVKDLARRLGRTYDACLNKAGLIGLRRPRHILAEFEVTLKRLHANGHSMKEIARRLRMTDVSVKSALERLGITPRGQHDRTAGEIDRWKESFGAFLDRSGGYESLREITSEREMGQAMARWPIAATRRQADVLDVLAEGPKQILEIAACLGIGRMRVTNILKALERLGAVYVASKGDRKANGGRVCPWTFAMFPGVERGKVVAGKVSVAV